MKKPLKSKHKSLGLLKFDLKMKISLLLFLTAMFSLQANNAYSQNTKVSLHMTNATVSQVIDEIESKTAFKFIFNTKVVDLQRKVSLKAKKQRIVKILNTLFDHTRTTYEIVDFKIFLRQEGARTKPNEEALAKQDPVRVTGRVIDEAGLPLVGVTVRIAGTNKGVATDFDGGYVITAPGPESVLVFTSIGFAVQEITIGDQTIINVTLKEAVNELDEVIISTGIFKRKAESFTGSAATITKEQLKRVGNANLFQAIRNVDASIAVFDNLQLGSNPNTLPEIQIRGNSTFPAEESELSGSLRGNYLKNPNQPLFILNGFESTIEQIFDLDINRIQSVTLLKDAASKAIYGSRAANGVVVIETQKLTNAKSRITYNTSVDIEIPDLTSYNLTNSLEKLEAERIDGVYLSRSADDYVALQQLYNTRRKLALEGLDTDWMAKPLQTGIGQRHSLTAEFGSGDIRILANLAYRDVKGVMKGSERKNITGNLTAFYRVKDLSFRNILSVNGNQAKDSPYGEFNEYAVMNPYWRAVNIDGTIPFYAEIAADGTRYTNPLFNSTLNSKLESSYLNFTNNFYLEWNILPELRATTRIGIDVKRSDADRFLPSDHTSFDSFVGEEARKRKGSYQLNNGKSSFLSGDFNINYSKQVNKHTYFANVGFNISENKFNEVVHTAEGFPSNQQDNIIFGRAYALDSRPRGIDGISRDIGFLAVGSYVYDNRFLSDLTLRTSASSLFGSNKRWAKFWSLGLGWNLHNEKFFKSGSVEQFRIRGSVGSTGNQNFNTNASIATYSYYLESLYQDFTGSFLLNLANADLQWETKFDYNVGLDAKIKGLSLQFDYYESITENLITDITVPNSTGFNTVKENLGKVKNSGIELNASYLAWSNDKGFLTFNVSLATNENEIIELSDAMQSFNDAVDMRAADRGNSRPLLKYVDGMSMNAIWAVPSLGIDPATGNEIYVKRDGNTTFEWNADDMIVAGNGNPSYRGNFGFNAEYKGFGLSVTGRYLGGGQIYNQTLVDKVENVDMNFNVDKRVLSGRWLVPGQQALFKRLGTFQPTGSLRSFPEKTRATTRFVQDLDELDLAAINVYYDFNDKILDELGLHRLRFSLNVNEVAKLSSITIERGTQFPFSRTVSYSLLATF